MTTLIKGSNLLAVRRLYQADGVTALLAADLSSARVELIQNGRIVRRIIMDGADTELRAHLTITSALVLEYTSEIVQALRAGDVTERYTLGVENDDFIIEPDQELHTMEVTDVTIEA